MSNNITRKDINKLVEEVAAAYGLSSSREQAKKLGHAYYLEAEYASVYGGYRLIGVNVSNGGHRGVFGKSGTEGRVGASLMAARLNGLLQGRTFHLENKL